MMAFCPKCGSEMADDDVFCRSCGARIEPLETDSSKEENKEDSKEESNKETKEDKKEEFKPNIVSSSKKEETVVEDNKLLLVPLVLGVIGFIVGIAEGLGCPMLFGWDCILTEMVIVVVGGLLGIFLYKFQEEYLIAGIEFIVTGALMVFLIGNMAMIGAIIFIIAGVLAIVLTKKFNANKNIFYCIPVATVLLAFVILLLFAASSVAALNDLSQGVSITNVNNTIAYSYGYYDGSIKGDISLNKSVEDFSMEMEFFDKNGRVLDKTYPLTENSIQAGKTYQFDGMYMKQEQPYTAQITLKQGYDDNNIFYVQNITLA